MAVMNTKSSVPANSLVWGEPDVTPDNTGRAKSIFFLTIAFFCIAGIYFIWVEQAPVAIHPSADGYFCIGLIELLIAIWIFHLLFSSHFRLDGIRADKIGLQIAYSCIPKVAGDYVNLKVVIPWNDEIHIEIGGDGEGAFWVNISLNKYLAHGPAKLRLTYPNEFAAKHDCFVFKSISTRATNPIHCR